MKNIFERKESKYLLSFEQFNIFTEKLHEYLSKDKYFNYKICNIYYDTNDYDLFRISSDKPIYKEKLRLRSYGTPDLSSIVFLEIKKKYDGIVYKRRINIPLKDVNSFISSPDDGNSINEKEIKYLLKRYELYPKVYLSYNRQAYFWHSNPDLRITFDSNIKYRMNDCEVPIR